MTPERYQQVADLYQAALEIAPAQRSAYLTEACAGNDDLRQEIEALFSYESQSKKWIDQPALELAARAMSEEQESSTASIIGRSVGRCRIIALLGKGGMGEVWLAEDIQLQRKVAIKLLPAEFTADAERVRRFAQEARAASALNHPNIITIYEIGAASTGTEDLHYIAAEYVEGQTLRQLIANAPHKQIQLANALAVAIQIAEALAAAHKAGIVHRDIKPENVMMRPDGYVKVLDFGLAKLTEPNAPTVDAETRSHTAHSTAAGIVIGTPRYMSPEQARGEKVDERTDIFSLGIMLYEMLAGQPPFVGATPSEMIAAILRDAPPSLDPLNVPPELERIIGQALRKDRAQRYQTAEDLLSDLNRFKEQLLMEKLVVSPTGESSRRRTLPSAGRATNKRRLATLIALAGIIVSLAAAVALFYFQRTVPPPGKDTVLLADFANQTDDDVFDGTLKQGLATQLEQSRFINVFPEVRVRQTLRQMERTDDTRITPELAQEICERQNLKAFIIGSMAPLGSHYVITLTGMRGNNGEELARVQTTATTKEQVLHALAEAAAQLRAKLGESLSSIQQSDQPLEQATTANLQALKAYSTCWKLNTLGRNAEALPFAKRAIELDPQFTSAYDQLVINAWATEQMEAAAEYQAKIVRLQEERAAQSKSPVSEYFKLDISTWYERLVTGNLNKSLETSLVRIQMYPRAFPVQNDLGISYLLNGQPEQSLAPFKETIRLNPNFAAPYKFMARALIRLNRFTEAKDTLAQALQLKLSTSDYHTSLYQLAVINADAVGMQQQLDWAKGKPDEYIALDWQTGAAAFTGQWRQAQEYSCRSVELAARSDNQELAARYATEQALRSAVLGDCRVTKANTAQGLSFGRGRLPLERAALALAMCGAASQAQALTSELTKRFPEDTLSQEIWQPLVRAALQLQRGSNQGAAQVIEQLQSTTRYESVAEFWPQYLRGLAYLKLGRGVESIAEFQKILDHRGYAPLSSLYPLAQLGLARAAALTGDTVKSRKSYEDFFAAWQQTDLELPILREARREHKR